MMKGIYTFLLCCLFAFNAKGQYVSIPYDDGPEMPNRRLVANHITVEKIYGYRFGKKGIADSVLLFTKSYQYNELGQLMRAEVNTDGKLKAYTKYKYDKYGLISNQVEVNVRSKTKTDSTMYSFVYDTLGNRRFTYKFNKDTSNVLTTEKIYNSKNQVISILIKVDDGEPFTQRAFNYNENGDLSGLYYMDRFGRETAVYSFYYEYPERRRIVYLSNDTGKKLYETYTYNINKDCTRKEHYSAVGNKDMKTAVPDEVVKYYYDEKGLLGNEVTYEGGTLVTYLKHFYSK